MNELLKRLRDKKTEDQISDEFWSSILDERHRVAKAVALVLTDAFRLKEMAEINVQYEGDTVRLSRGEDWMKIGCTDEDNFMTECAVVPDSLPEILGVRSHVEFSRNRISMLDDVIRWAGVK
jgi:hypothetical protein